MQLGLEQRGLNEIVNIISSDVTPRLQAVGVLLHTRRSLPGVTRPTAQLFESNYLKKLLNQKVIYFIIA